MKILAFIEVNEEVIKSCADTENVSEAINSEFCWITQSGMEVIKWVKIEE